MQPLSPSGNITEAAAQGIEQHHSALAAAIHPEPYIEEADVGNEEHAGALVTWVNFSMWSRTSRKISPILDEG